MLHGDGPSKEIESPNFSSRLFRYAFLSLEAMVRLSNMDMLETGSGRLTMTLPHLRELEVKVQGIVVSYLHACT